MIKQSLCQERRDSGILCLFFSDITQTVRIVYIFFCIFYNLFSFCYDFCAASMNFSQLYVVFLSIFFHVQILFNFIFAANAKKTQLCNCAPSGTSHTPGLFCYYWFLCVCQKTALYKADIHNPLRYLLMNAVASRSAFISALITVLLSWQLHLQRGLPVQKS